MDNSPHNPTLREQLDAVRPDADDLHDADLQAAARTIEASDEWRAVFERQQAFDREVAAVMLDVDVPAGLQSRLQGALSAERQSASPTEPAPTLDKTSLSRRSWTRILATAAAVVMATGLGWLVWPHGPAAVTLDEVRQSLPFENGSLNTLALSDFDNSFAAPLPSHDWVGWQEARVKGLDLDGDGTHDAAIYAFQVRGTHGYLVVLPTARITDPPVRTFFSTAGISYTPVSNVAWSDHEGDVVYLCLIDRGQLDTLSRLLTPAAA